MKKITVKEIRLVESRWKGYYHPVFISKKGDKYYHTEGEPGGHSFWRKGKYDKQT